MTAPFIALSDSNSGKPIHIRADRVSAIGPSPYDNVTCVQAGSAIWQVSEPCAEVLRLVQDALRAARLFDFATGPTDLIMSEVRIAAPAIEVTDAARVLGNAIAKGSAR